VHAKAYPDLEGAQTDFILQSLDELSGISRFSQENDFAVPIKHQQNGFASKSSLNNGPLPAVHDVQMSSLVSSVHELLPDLGPGFVEACLMHFDLDHEKVIQALLDDALPEDLQKMDR